MTANWVTLRPANRGDAVELATLEVACFADPWSQQSVENEIGTAHGRAWIAHVDQQPVGYLLAWLVGDEGQINRVGVVPGLRGRSLGRRLIVQLLATAASEGATSVVLEVAADNTAALAMYRSCGFVEIGRRRKYYADGRDAVVMRAPTPVADNLVDLQ
ncbi:MAG: ribosomal-protein-alanine N-acetyltransferase [Myxococcales bacterium]|nr:ribosomal-protein-alanine N-acetyltransferase [Myxococcales bacterium]